MGKTEWYEYGAWDECTTQHPSVYAGKSCYHIVAYAEMPDGPTLPEKPEVSVKPSSLGRVVGTYEDGDRPRFGCVLPSDIPGPKESDDEPA